MTDELLRYRDVTLSYDGRTPAAERLNLQLAQGQALALVGPNGSGKSTLLKSMIGLVAPTTGELAVLGGRPRAAAAHVGYLAQHDHIDLEFPISLRQVVMLGRYRALGPLRWPGRADRDAVQEALERVNLVDVAERRFGDLSGGQRQRGFLARALVTRPRILLLDEPFNGLDTPNRKALMQTLRELREAGMGIVVSTHDFELAHQVCTHVLLVNQHQIAYGDIHEVLQPEAIAETFGESHDHFDTHSDLVAHPHPVATPDKPLL
ncbi:metal ABC transporter ATP-binding protein [Gulosibacter massiliensis]|uniref:metal ABC transporter ATP-binding protein n=2 Tax=Gulosibacter TaxID=256818 RepID=UPI000F62F6A3|nr:metal ABC transporter ATP-binding protein [Gulosibacter massiliensis]